ncbi:MAG: LpxI family protein [Terriglobia bacterium]
MVPSQNFRYAIIAGNGRFPFLVLEAARQQGIDPVVFAIKEEASPDLSAKASVIHWLSLGEIAKLMDLLHSERIKRAVLAGQVKHAQLFSTITADNLVSGALANLERRNTDALIGAFVGMLEGQGIEVLDSTLFLRPLLAGAGVMTARRPDASDISDVEYGEEIARKVAALDIGQTVVVAERACVAVEAMEGTDAAIERAAALSKGRRLVVVKVNKPRQDMRFDVPVTGAHTVDVMIRANARVLAVDAGSTLLFERDLMLQRANEAGIVILGMTAKDETH